MWLSRDLGSPPFRPFRLLPPPLILVLMRKPRGAQQTHASTKLIAAMIARG